METPTIANEVLVRVGPVTLKEGQGGTLHLEWKDYQTPAITNCLVISPKELEDLCKFCAVVVNLNLYDMPQHSLMGRYDSWICPECENIHNSPEQAEECCREDSSTPSHERT